MDCLMKFRLISWKKKIHAYLKHEKSFQYEALSNRRCFNIYQMSAIGEGWGQWGPLYRGLGPTGMSLYSDIQVMVTWDPACRQTDTTENTTFPQLRWRGVKTRNIVNSSDGFRTYLLGFQNCWRNALRDITWQSGHSGRICVTAFILW